MTMIKSLTLLFFLPLLFSCAYSVHEVQFSDFTPYAPLEKSGEIIKSSGQQFVVMGFVTDTNYVDNAYKSFQNKCPNGQISSVSTQFLTELGFFSWNNKIHFQGICRSSKN